MFLYDNPFGEMASKHVLDPVFEISKALRFQWLIVTPPELVKNDISTRFNVYWQLSFSGAKGEIVESTLVKGGRKSLRLRFLISYTAASWYDNSREMLKQFISPVEFFGFTFVYDCESAVGILNESDGFFCF